MPVDSGILFLLRFFLFVRFIFFNPSQGIVLLDQIFFLFFFPSLPFSLFHASFIQVKKCNFSSASLSVFPRCDACWSLHPYVFVLKVNHSSSKRVLIIGSPVWPHSILGTPPPTSCCRSLVCHSKLMMKCLALHSRCDSEATLLSFTSFLGDKLFDRSAKPWSAADKVFLVPNPWTVAAAQHNARAGVETNRNAPSRGRVL